MLVRGWTIHDGGITSSVNGPRGGTTGIARCGTEAERTASESTGRSGIVAVGGDVARAVTNAVTGIATNRPNHSER